MALATTHEDLAVFQKSIDAAMLVYAAYKTLPGWEERDLGIQWLRCSRSVAANIAEAWRKRYYPAHFKSKLSDVECEAAESQVWALLCLKCGYLNETTYAAIHQSYDIIIRQAVTMARESSKWKFRSKES